MIPITHITGRLGNQMFQFAYLYTQFRKGNIPEYYLQDEKYFEEYKDAIKSIYRQGLSQERLNYVSIHVRRGDYVKNDFYVDLFQDGYYERAMAEFTNEQFLVFSDDINWCKQQELFKECQFSEGLNEIQDMNRMTQCKGHIIANSSFSWWPAYLSGNTTIAPMKWFQDGIQRVGLLKEWKRI